MINLSNKYSTVVNNLITLYPNRYVLDFAILIMPMYHFNFIPDKLKLQISIKGINMNTRKVFSNGRILMSAELSHDLNAFLSDYFNNRRNIIFNKPFFTYGNGFNPVFCSYF